MLRLRPAHMLHRAALLVLIFGLCASLFGWWQSERSLHHSNDVLLVQDANQASLLLEAYIPVFGAAPTQLSSVVTPFGIPTSVFQAIAAPAVKDGGAIALLREAGGHLQVIDAVGTLHHAFGGLNDATLIQVSTSSDKFVGAGVSGGSRYVSQIYGTPTVPKGFAVYVESALPASELPANGHFQIPGQLFTGIQATVYANRPSPSNMVFTTSAVLPSGRVAVVAVNSQNAFLTDHPENLYQPGKLLLVLTPKGNLSGTSAALFPFLLLLVGLASVLTVAALLEIALRRRDEAFGVADSLRSSNEQLDHKNAELDLALTRQAEAEQSLRQAQRMEAVGQLAGGIAHDFNNLLHVILSYSSFLADETGDREAIEADVAEIQTAAHRAAELTRQLLIFSRNDVSRATALNMNAIVTNAERILRRALGEDISLTCVTNDSDCIIMADAAEIDQVLMNLTTNARDAMPHGGSLEISVKCVCDDGGDSPIPAPFVRVDVRDDGEGMPDEIAAKAFDPFFTTKEPGRGTGLGLAMVYGIVTRWGGDAIITTGVGTGTTVSMFFPVASPSDVEHVGVSDAISVVGGAETVLLVEDEESVLRSTSRVLTSAGYTVVTASNALEAAQAFDESPIDVVVTDVIMPGGVSGKQLADSLRCGHPDLPVVFVSGYSADTIAERGVLPAQTHLVKKPFAPDELLLAIREAITQDSVEHAFSS
ncbi:MAG TPA: ATP-binding protein [Acidimicrobiales bacterium]|nr:ATP-binding protein [Acidimicrobiales bacterium]